MLYKTFYKKPYLKLENFCAIMQSTATSGNNMKQHENKKDIKMPPRIKDAMKIQVEVVPGKRGQRISC
uniref:Ribosomal protein L11 n=1 Tax=Romanomermis culicivorax TaxID=13658 RepID=A0A915JGA6_ROMCU